MVVPGAPVAPPSLLLSVRSGPPVIGVVSLPELLLRFWSVPLVPSSAMLAVLLICVTPAGMGVTTVTAKVALPIVPPPASVPIASVQVLPALPLGVQLQPAVLAPALKVVLAGTVSVKLTL